MGQAEQTVSLDPADPASWAEHPFEALFTLSRDEVAGVQREAVVRRFESLRHSVSALDKLATRQGVDRIASVEGAVPVFFDHRVLKAYPLSLIEKHQFDKLTAWLQRLTAHDLTSVSLDGVSTVDDWLQRLDDNGMIIGHSTGTTGKLSFIPRSESEWPAWKSAYYEAQRAATGIDLRTEVVETFSPMYRNGHQMMVKMNHLFAAASAGGEEHRHVLYEHPLSSELLSLAGRLQGAEERGELGKLEFDPTLLVRYKDLIELGRNRNDHLQQWFVKLAEEYRGQRVVIRGTSADLVRLAVIGQAQGVVCEFARDSVVFAGGGMKGYRDAPADWQGVLRSFYGVDRLSSVYSMSECLGLAPKCREGHYHFLPYMIPLVLDEHAVPLPKEGVQTGRMALFDLLAETYWGAFISGDQVTIHWEEDCACGWKGPRIEDSITRYAEMEGGDDKITCAGTAQAYNEFMDYVSSI